MSVCLSNRPYGIGSQYTDFHEILYLSIFRKYMGKIQDFIKLWQE